jgi:ectoine hydroxylase-related dioxygenase (phytanoyl-CoA dioxygenase family)
MSAPTQLVPQLTDEMVTSYRERGFVRIPQVLTPTEVERFRDAVVAYRQRVGMHPERPTFAQYVDVWRDDETVAELTRHPVLAAAAERLAGIPLRIWHDQTLVKDPHNGAPTEFHQDQPYWPHANSQHALSAWVALVDVPVERGCMTFVPGSQSQTDLRMQNLDDHWSLQSMWPQLEWSERVTLPVRAGDCTFHNSFTAHTANSNDTDEARIAHVVIFMDAEATYSGLKHVVTDPLGMAVGERFSDERFPRVS